MKYCPNCGKQLKDDARFCGKCGNPVREIRPAEIRAAETAAGPAKRKKQKKKKGYLSFILVFAVLAAGVCGTLGFRLVQKRGSVGEIYYKRTDPEHVKGDGTIAYIDNEVLLTASEKTGKKDIEALIRPYGGEIVGYIEATGDYQIEFPEVRTADDLNELADVLINDPAVKRASLNYVDEIRTSAVLKDNEDAREWAGSERGAWGWQAIHVPEAWEYLKEPDTKAVNVGVLEGSTFYLKHPAIDRTYEYCSFAGDPGNSHGSAVASVIAGENTGPDGVYGVYPLGREANGEKHLYFGSTQAVSVRNARRDMAGLMSYKAEIADLAMRDCKVINASFGTSMLYEYLYPDTAAAAEMIENRKREAIEMGEFLRDLFTAKDFLLVQAAGNDSNFYYITAKGKEDDKGNIIAYDYDPASAEIYRTDEKGSEVLAGGTFCRLNGGDPSRVVYLQGQLPMEYNSLLGALRWFGTDYQDVLDHIIITGAIKKDFETDSYEVAGFSNEGELYMPGQTVRCAINTGSAEAPVAGYGDWDGTSFSAPMLTGVAAMVWSRNEYLTAPSVKKILQNNLVQYDDITMVDAEAAVKRSGLYAQVPDEGGKGKGILAGVFAVYEAGEDGYSLDGYLDIKNLKDGKTANYLVKGNTDFYLALEEGDYQLVSVGVNDGSYGEIRFTDKTFHIDDGQITYEKIPMYETFLNGTIKMREREYYYPGTYDKRQHTETNCVQDFTLEDTIAGGKLVKRHISALIRGDVGGLFPDIIAYSYNGQGLVSKEESSLDDGQLIAVKDYTYDDHGNAVRIVTNELNPFYEAAAYMPGYEESEWIEHEDIYEYTYNPDGTIAGYRFYGNYDGVKVLYETVEYAYDGSKRIISKSTVIPSISNRMTEEYYYDEFGRKVAVRDDSPAGSGQWTYKYKYDSFDRMTEEIFESVYQGNSHMTVRQKKYEVYR